MSDPKQFVPPTSNLHVAATIPLAPPQALKQDLPVSRSIAETVLAARATVRDIIDGKDPRLLAIVGPCSIHDPDAALEYASRLAVLREETLDVLYILMRVYFEKPRTSVGWKGLINDPHLDGSRDMETGLRIARRLLLEINALRLPAATEMLGPVVPQYTADLVSWSAVGARTAESQTHREIASGLSMPVGFKNGTDGNLQVALDGMHTAATPHSFLGIDEDGRPAIFQTTGNPDRHLVLRGGNGKTNYQAEFIEQAAVMLRRAGLPARIMVDCSHGNSGKDHTRQPGVLKDVVGQIRDGSQHILGFMLESHLFPGHQRLEEDPRKLQYGVSITDACLDWPTTEKILLEAAQECRSATGHFGRKQASSG